MQKRMTLNEAQRAAVEHHEGPLLVLAGAGAGKTKVITHRVLRLIERGASPREILAVTFTNKAAREMRERVQNLLSHSALGVRRGEEPFISTFHSLGVSLLRSHARALNLPRSFAIFDRGDSLRSIKEAMVLGEVNPKEFEPRKILGTISREKGNGVTLSLYREERREFYPRLVASVWEHYDAILNRERALDFDDLLLRTLKLLERNKDILASYRNTWQYLHIDEYQDTNRVQYRLAKLLANPRNNICAVGDVDQNIYSWRGADIDNILSFERTYPKARVILLEENYRSTKTIIEASNTIIEKNKRRKKKRLFTRNPSGEKIALALLYDESAEARFVAEEMRRALEGGVRAREIAVLYRANFQSRALEEALLENDIPYQVLGIRFFERKEVKDVLSFLRAALNPESLADIKRVINVPPRGIGKVTLLKIALGKEAALPSKMRERVASFRSLLEDIRGHIEKHPASKTIAFVLKASGLEDSLRTGAPDDLERLENMRELVTLATRYDKLSGRDGVEKLLDDAALATEQDELSDERDAVKLMTVHAAKGLEFDTVFVTGLEDGLFPHESLGEETDDEEERRLFYVALTRAKRKAFLTHTSVRTIFGSREVNTPSEFILDIDDRLIEERYATKNPREEAVIRID